MRLGAEQQKQFSDVLDELGRSLDITQTQYANAVRSYEAVGNLLARESSPLAEFRPIIRPQGSFMLGTMVRPEIEADELDIDLVCELTGKSPDWTQHDLKQMVGNEIRSTAVYKEKTSEGRRCWTIDYSDTSNYHMDILPSIVSSDYRTVIEKSFSAAEFDAIEDLSIRITDNKEPIYRTETDISHWPTSNPFGYSKWFFRQATIEQKLIREFQESVQPVPQFQVNKLPLQRVVQILKRHRDLMFKGDPDKPRSIIITTLAARAYGKEVNVIDALLNVVEVMPTHMERRYSRRDGKDIVWICNPTNDSENFADKWPDSPRQQEHFFNWMRQVRADIHNAIDRSGSGMNAVMESLEKALGKDAVRRAYTSYAESHKALRESGALKMAAGTGMLGRSGIKVKDHTFHGK